MVKIILGSASPRRRELLSGLDIDFTVDTGNNFRESMDPDASPYDIPVRMAEGKSLGFHRPLSEEELLITADTVVIIREEGRVLGKPSDREDAIAMLRLLSGRTHEVLTAVCFRDKDSMHTVTNSTLVHFRDLDENEIIHYVDRYCPFDKAGSYGVQEWIGYVSIDRIEGSFYNVMGLPVHAVYEEIKKRMR